MDAWTHGKNQCIWTSEVSMPSIFLHWPFGIYGACMVHHGANVGTVAGAFLRGRKEDQCTSRSFGNEDLEAEGWLWPLWVGWLVNPRTTLFPPVRRAWLERPRLFSWVSWRGLMVLPPPLWRTTLLPCCTESLRLNQNSFVDPLSYFEWKPGCLCSCTRDDLLCLFCLMFPIAVRINQSKRHTFFHHCSHDSAQLLGSLLHFSSWYSSWAWTMQLAPMDRFFSSNKCGTSTLSQRQGCTCTCLPRFILFNPGFIRFPQ